MYTLPIRVARGQKTADSYGVHRVSSRLGQWAAAALALLAACASSRSHLRARRARTPPPPHARSVVRVATLNAHLLFDTTCDSGRCGDGDFERAPTEAEFARDLDVIAAAVRALDADVVLLQEVENQRCLDALRARLGDAYPTAILGETGRPASIDVAVLARDPMVSWRGHRGVPFERPDGRRGTFARELLEVHLDHAGRRVVVFAAHFRSKVRDDPGQRHGEALAARRIVTARGDELPDALVVLGGDLNDTPGSPAIDALEAGGALARVAAALPVEAQATYVFRGRPMALDHLFVPRALMARVVAGSVRVERDAPGEGYAGSDHASLRADFNAE